LVAPNANAFHPKKQSSVTRVMEAHFRQVVRTYRHSIFYLKSNVLLCPSMYQVMVCIVCIERFYRIA
jgi:hypothetical protein